MAWRAFLFTASGSLCRSHRPSSGGQMDGGGGNTQPVGTSQLSSTQPPSTLRTPQVSTGTGQYLGNQGWVGGCGWEERDRSGMNGGNWVGSLAAPRSVISYNGASGHTNRPHHWGNQEQ